MSSNTTEKTPDEIIAEVEERKDARRKKRMEAWKAQNAIDVVAIEELEYEHGDLHTVSFDDAWRHGDFTLVAFKIPTKEQTKKFASKGSQKGPEAIFTATRDFALGVVVYPERSSVLKMMERFPNLDATIALAANELAAGDAEDKKK